MTDLSRRRLLQVGGTGTALAIAGCGELDSSDDDTEPDDPNGDTDDDGADDTENGGSDDGDEAVEGYTAAAAPDEEEVATLQEEFEQIQEDAQSGEITQEEAEQQSEEIFDAFDELMADTVAAISAHVEETAGLSLSDTLEEDGALLVDGEAEDLIALLDRPDVDGLFGAETFVELQQQDEQLP